jgi:Peptidase family M28
MHVAQMQFRPTPAAVQQQLSAATPLLAVLAWCWVFMLAGVAIFALKAPDAVPAGAPQNEFSAQRALAHVRAVARVPHPTGTNANAEVRQYLLGQLSALGLNPQPFTAVGIDNDSWALVAGRTNDIVGRLSGTENSGAILLMAHYDSVSSGPGAADDASGVAAILEGLRALKTGTRLKNDLIVLITDGEEPGLLGAESFVASHPWMEDVGLVMNFEARGNHGPSMLFETSANNAALLNEVARTATYPVGSSLFYSLYKLLPNDTDFTQFRPARIPGLNFAFGEHLEAYHSRLDTPENLDPASLQHHGSYLVSLVRQFGQMDLGSLKRGSGDNIFFDWFGANMITYSERWNLIGQIVVTFLLGAVILSSIQRAEVSPGRFFKAVAVSFLMVAVITGVMVFAGWLLLLILSGRMLLGDTAANSFLLSGLVLLGIATGSVVLTGLRRRFHLEELSLAGLTVVCILSWAFALLLPGGHYLLFWPLFLAVCGFLVLAILRPGSSKGRVLAILPAVAITVLLFAPVAYLLYAFLTLSLLSIIATGLLLGLFFLICVPFVNMAVPPRTSRTILLPLFVAATASIAVGILRSNFSSQHPRQDHLLYSMNADDRTAVWVSDDFALDGYTAQFLGGTPSRKPVPDYLTGSLRAPFSASAPLVDLQPPIGEIEVDEQKGDLHRLRMNVRSQRDADFMVVRFDPRVKPVSIEISGRSVKPLSGRNGLFVLLYGMDVQGAELDLTLNAPSGVSFWVSDYSAGLPTTIRRPSEFIAIQGSDQTIVCRKYKLK